MANFLESAKLSKQEIIESNCKIDTAEKATFKIKKHNFGSKKDGLQGKVGPCWSSYWDKASKIGTKEVKRKNFMEKALVYEAHIEAIKRVEEE